MHQVFCSNIEENANSSSWTKSCVLISLSYSASPRFEEAETHCVLSCLCRVSTCVFCMIFFFSVWGLSTKWSSRALTKGSSYNTLRSVYPSPGFADLGPVYLSSLTKDIGSLIKAVILKLKKKKRSMKHVVAFCHIIHCCMVWNTFGYSLLEYHHGNSGQKTKIALRLP